MNIFFLDRDPVLAAQMQHDKHVVKMILETTQILSTVHHRYQTGLAPYKPTHANHPCVLWAGDNVSNYDWLQEHGIALCAEYTHRYGREHACQTHLQALRAPPGTCPVGLPTPAPQCVSEGSKTPLLPWHGDEFDATVDAYRSYYLADKVHQSRWTGRPVPAIFKEAIMAKATPAVKEAPTKATKEAATETETAARPRGPKGVELTAKIKLLVDTNPKRAGSKSFDRFAAYKNGMTVDAALDAGVLTADLIYDTAHKFVEIEGYTPPKFAPEKKVKEPKAETAKEPKGEVVKKAKKAAPASSDEDLE